MNFAEFEHDRRIREGILSETIPSTAASFEVVSTHILFPSKIRKRRILEIGSGLSPAIFELQRRGAYAIGLDSKYWSLDHLIHSSDRYIDDPNRESKEDVFVRKEGKKGDLELRFLAEENANREKFLNSLKSEKSQLVAGIAGDLPFADNSIDFIYSLNTIFPGLTADYDTFMKSIYEGYRVLAPGGEFQIFPVSLNSGTTNALIEVLRALKIKHTWKPTSVFDGGLNNRGLRIFK